MNIDTPEVDVQELLEQLAAQGERVAALEAQVAASAPPPQNTFVPPTFRDFRMRPEVLSTTRIYSIPGSDLPRGMRELRQLAAAVAISQGDPVPAGRDIPSTYPPVMRQIHTARQGGATWRDALVAAGLEVPSGEKIAELALALRDDLLENPLWNGLLPAVAAVHARAKAHEKTDTLEALRSLMSDERTK